MCDTVVALSNATQDGSVIFGKNSDREPNEAHYVALIPAELHKDELVKCTYVSIPQVRETHAVLLAKPFWLWGAEMGANDCGVVIGNEALFTKTPYDKGPALIGMDFLRLALERSDTASRALDTIIELLETYGQGGNCGFAHTLYYHNSFLIADSSEAWVLETSGRQWAAEKVIDVRSISNGITIGSEWDKASAGLVDEAIQQGWCKDRKTFNFAHCYSDFLYTTFSDSKRRQNCTTSLLKAQMGKITAKTVMDVLRDHGEKDQSGKSPADGLTGASVCMHASLGPIRASQSVGAMVSTLTPAGATHWVTATSGTCTSIFKPVWMDSGLPDMGPVPNGTYDEAALWWRHENLHREVMRDYVTRMKNYQMQRDELETSFITRASKYASLSSDERYQLSSDCFNQADIETTKWRDQVQSNLHNGRFQPFFNLAWNGFDRKANRTD